MPCRSKWCVAINSIAVNPARVRGYRYLGMLLLAAVYFALPGGLWAALWCLVWAVACDVLLSLWGANLAGVLVHSCETLVLCVAVWFWPLPQVAMVCCALALIASSAAQSGWLGIATTLVVALVVLLVWSADQWLLAADDLPHAMQPNLGLASWLALVLLGVFTVSYSLAGHRNATRLQLHGSMQRHLIQRLSRYLPETLMRRLFAAPGLPAVLQQRWLVVGFVDLTGFTALCERLAPQEQALMHNDFYCRLQQLSDVTQGTLCKTLGDGALLVWGDGEPTSRTELVARGLRFCQLMHASRPALWTRWSGLGDPARLNLRTGLACGDCIVGDWGAGRLHYTVLGRSVNLAFRLQQRARPGYTLVCADIAQVAGLRARATRRNLQLKGLGRVRAFEL